MLLTSNSLMACPDSCISDSGANCFMCERLHETKFIKILMLDKFELVIKEEKEIKYAEDYILEKKMELINEEVTLIALDGELTTYIPSL